MQESRFSPATGAGLKAETPRSPLRRRQVVVRTIVKTVRICPQRIFVPDMAHSPRKHSYAVGHEAN